MRSQLIASFKLNKKDYTVKTTRHASKRIEERGISQEDVKNIVYSLEIEEILRLQKEEKEAMLQVPEKGFSMVLSWLGNKLNIVTIIDKPRAKCDNFGNTEVITF